MYIIAVQDCPKINIYTPSTPNPPIVYTMHDNHFYCRLVETFEKKSREASMEPSTNKQDYPQAQKLSEAVARGLEGSGEEDEGDEGEETGEDREYSDQQTEPLSSDDDDIV